MNSSIAHQLDVFKNTSKTSESLIIEGNLSPELIYFQGHFPQQPILPAVAMVQLTVWLIQKFLKHPNQKLIQVTRGKFKEIFLPKEVVTILIEIKANDEYRIQWKKIDIVAAQFQLKFE